MLFEIMMNSHFDNDEIFTQEKRRASKARWEELDKNDENEVEQAKERFTDKLRPMLLEHWISNAKVQQNWKLYDRLKHMYTYWGGSGPEFPTIEDVEKRVWKDISLISFNKREGFYVEHTKRWPLDYDAHIAVNKLLSIDQTPSEEEGTILLDNGSVRSRMQSIAYDLGLVSAFHPGYFPDKVMETISNKARTISYLDSLFASR